MDFFKIIELSAFSVALIIILASIILWKSGVVSNVSFRKLAIIFGSLMALFFIAISYQSIREHFSASQTTVLQSETNAFGQEFVKSLVGNSLTQQERIDLNKRVSDLSTIDDPASMYEFLKSKGITKYLGSEFTPEVSENSTKPVGLSLWQIGLFMAMYNKHDIDDFLIVEVDKNVVSITLKKDRVQNDLDKMLNKSSFGVGKENGEDKVQSLSLFDDKFLKSLRFAQ